MRSKRPSLPLAARCSDYKHYILTPGLSFQLPLTIPYPEDMADVLRPSMSIDSTVFPPHH